MLTLLYLIRLIKTLGVIQGVPSQYQWMNAPLYVCIVTTLLSVWFSLYQALQGRAYVWQLMDSDIYSIKRNYFDRSILWVLFVIKIPCVTYRALIAHVPRWIFRRKQWRVDWRCAFDMTLKGKIRELVACAVIYKWIWGILITFNQEGCVISVIEARLRSFEPFRI